MKYNVSMLFPNKSSAPKSVVTATAEPVLQGTSLKPANQGVLDALAHDDVRLLDYLIARGAIENSIMLPGDTRAASIYQAAAFYGAKGCFDLLVVRGRVPIHTRSPLPAVLKAFGERAFIGLIEAGWPAADDKDALSDMVVECLVNNLQDAAKVLSSLIPKRSPVSEDWGIQTLQSGNVPFISGLTQGLERSGDLANQLYHGLHEKVVMGIFRKSIALQDAAAMLVLYKSGFAMSHVGAGDWMLRFMSDESYNWAVSFEATYRMQADDNVSAAQTRTRL